MYKTTIVIMVSVIKNNTALKSLYLRWKGKSIYFEIWRPQKLFGEISNHDFKDY